jgi:hypothetical protein
VSLNLRRCIQTVAACRSVGGNEAVDALGNGVRAVGDGGSKITGGMADRLDGKGIIGARDGESIVDKRKGEGIIDRRDVDERGLGRRRRN